MLGKDLNLFLGGIDSDFDGSMFQYTQPFYRP